MLRLFGGIRRRIRAFEDKDRDDQDCSKNYVLGIADVLSEIGFKELTNEIYDALSDDSQEVWIDLAKRIKEAMK